MELPKIDDKKFFAKDIDKWNTTDFHEYMGVYHEIMFGVPYVPMGTWQAEKGMLGRFVGTTRKEGEVSKRVAKRFIDKMFATFKPTGGYVGVSFGFLHSYRKSDIQIAIKEERDGANNPYDLLTLYGKEEEKTVEVDYGALADLL